MPYRTTRSAAPKLTAEAGIVDDMVRQFADRYAFLRELVQNAIDAGAKRIEVRVERDPNGGVRTSVDDDGSGMTRKIIEGPLLTLFSSSKESDSTKIGKYGIGFVSVFAIEPEHVEVDTKRGDEAWHLRLFGDHSYELREGARSTGNGTTVTLVQTLDLESFAAHAASASAALRRWCRHARVPITLIVNDGHSPGGAVPVNVPLSLPGLVTLSVTEGDEHIVVSVGAAPPGAAAAEDMRTFGGFYNRGLTLMETNEPEAGLEGVRFKVDSARLSHTLSRDSVRRDDEHRRALARVTDLVNGRLATKLLVQIEEAATEAAAGSWASYAALLDAALVRGFTGRARDLALRADAPLVEAVAGENTMELAAIRKASPVRVLVAEESGPITRALAKREQPVVRHMALAPLLTRIFGDDSTREASLALAYACAVEKARPEDDALAEALVPMLRAAGRKIARVCVASFHGLASDERCRVVRGVTGEALSAPTPAADRPWSGSSTLFLNADDAMVRLARRRARTAPQVAAHLLCRGVLLAEGPLEEKHVDALLAFGARERGHGV